MLRPGLQHRLLPKGRRRTPPCGLPHRRSRWGEVVWTGVGGSAEFCSLCEGHGALLLCTAVYVWVESPGLAVDGRSSGRVGWWVRWRASGAGGWGCVSNGGAATTLLQPGSSPSSYPPISSAHPSAGGHPCTQPQQALIHTPSLGAATGTDIFFPTPLLKLLLQAPSRRTIYTASQRLKPRHDAGPGDKAAGAGGDCQPCVHGAAAAAAPAQHPRVPGDEGEGVAGGQESRKRMGFCLCAKGRASAPFLLACLPSTIQPYART